MAHDWSTAKTRGFLFAVFAMANSIQIALLGFAFGKPVLHFVVLGIAFFPLVYLGSLFGLPLGNRMNKMWLRRIAFALLLVIGVSATVSALMSYV